MTAVLKAAAPASAIVIGGSAGSMTALRQLLQGLGPALTAELALPPIIAVLHLKEGMSTDWQLCLTPPAALRVIEASDKDELAANHLYLSPPGYHLLVERERVLSLSVDPRVNLARPSIDVLFETAAEAFGPDLVGVIMSGASRDGAHGLKAVAAAGGLALVQAPETAEFAVMPQAALDLTPSATALPTANLSALLATFATSTLASEAEL